MNETMAAYLEILKFKSSQAMTQQLMATLKPVDPNERAQAIIDQTQKYLDKGITDDPVVAHKLAEADFAV